MLIKNAGTLSQKYFQSYFQLTMNSQHCNADQAKKIIFDRFFAGNTKKLGATSYQNFMNAYKQCKEG
ncbi:hypothetical protein [Lentibacillus sp. Marseille-P4043]|uniref:hypothetical protein n=1 Tax=Lentibacillus sp. Marseille-P4043 TaxID=2040293 RepID=UPI000D0B860A|nr:hypothetical protein [Lentibacillus sp. Marseille-P4043]